MKIWYQCEICSNRYKNPQEALDCEASGWQEYPIGTIYGDATNSKSHHDYNMTFCVASNKQYHHMNVGSSWACRDNGREDSLGESQCRGNSLHLNEYDAVKDFTHPTFVRMVQWLKSEGIKPLVWDGKKAVKWEDLKSEI